MTSHKYVFDSFEFDSNRLTLYFGGDYVAAEKKALEVLAAIIKSPGEVVTTDEIIYQVWGDNSIGVTPTHLAQSISKLRKLFKQFIPEEELIVTVRGRGYMFQYQVDVLNADSDLDGTISRPAPHLTAQRTFAWKWAAAACVLIALFAVLGFGWYSFGGNEVEDIKRVVEASQKYESLVLYRNPAQIDEEAIQEYWITDSKTANDLDIQRIRASAEKLVLDKKHYGKETKNEQFDFQKVEISESKDFATVKTLEKWFISVYDSNGKLIKNKTVGPYFVHYSVRKVDGKWLVEKSSTARATVPPPILDKLVVDTNPIPDERSYANILGSSFVPDSIHLFIVGPGCPETKPCTITNSELRIHSKMSNTQLTNVPLTLAQGEYLIFARNGNESLPSNSVSVTVKAKSR